MTYLQNVWCGRYYNETNEAEQERATHTFLKGHAIQVLTNEIICVWNTSNGVHYIEIEF